MRALGKDPSNEALHEVRKLSLTKLPTQRGDQLKVSMTVEVLMVNGAQRRDTLLPALEAAGFRVFVPDGAYYVMTDFSGIEANLDDIAFARRLVEDPGVAAVPGSSFYSRPELGRSKIRFAFPKRPETLAAAAERLARLRVPAA